MTPTVKLFNGQQMPIVGLGTYLATDAKELETALEVSLKAGYRHIDTAYVYKNETIIGNVVKRWLEEGKITREELFIVTKLPSYGMHPSKVGHFIKKSLRNLQVDYIDLYLVHVPFGVKYFDDDVTQQPMKDGKFELDLETNLEQVWKAMEDQVDAGLAKSIGISNFNSDQVERVMKIARIQPANNQIEVSIYVQMKDVRSTCEKYGISICAYSPLGRPGKKSINMLEDPIIIELGKKYKRTRAQIALRFLVQQNVAVIPKSVTEDRIHKNIELFDFSLSDQELEVLSSLDRGVRSRVCMTDNNTKGLDEHPEWPFPRD